MKKTTALVLLFTFSSCNFRVLFLNCVNLIKSLELLQLTGHTACDTHTAAFSCCATTIDTLLWFEALLLLHRLSQETTSCCLLYIMIFLFKTEWNKVAFIYLYNEIKNN